MARIHDSNGNLWNATVDAEGGICLEQIGHTVDPETLSRADEAALAEAAELEAELSEVDPFEHAHEAWKESRLAA